MFKNPKLNLIKNIVLTLFLLFVYVKYPLPFFWTLSNEAHTSFMANFYFTCLVLSSFPIILFGFFTVLASEYVYKLNRIYDPYKRKWVKKTHIKRNW